MQDEENIKNDLAQEREKSKFQEIILSTFVDMKKKIDSLESTAQM